VDPHSSQGNRPEADPELDAGSDPAPAAGARPRGAGPAPEPDDHALIRRAQAGEEQAFELLVRRYQARAWRVARNMVASDEDAQDLAQEAFLRVFKSLERFDFEHEFPTWLYRIVTNLAIDHLRRRRPAQSTSGGDDDEGELDLVDPLQELPSAAVEREETIDAVRDCLASLAPHFQSVLVLRELEGLACNEIAEIVGATHVTVRWRLHRGRKLFQEEWERRGRLAERGPAGLQSPLAGAPGAEDGEDREPANTGPDRP
jgi:RNA polymerase sigma-70 factor (ECF subfamily)